MKDSNGLIDFQGMTDRLSYSNSKLLNTRFTA